MYNNTGVQWRGVCIKSRQQFLNNIPYFVTVKLNYVYIFWKQVSQHNMFRDMPKTLTPDTTKMRRRDKFLKSPVTPRGEISLGQHGFMQWPFTWWHQTNFCIFRMYTGDYTRKSNREYSNIHLFITLPPFHSRKHFPLSSNLNLEYSQHVPS